MATHDYIIDNASGATVRSDLNNALSAIVSNNSSATEPSTTYAYQWWADTSSDTLKQRNSSNNGWVSILTLSTGSVTTAPAPADNSITGAKIAMGSDAQGDVLYYNGTDYARLGAGTSGQFLKTQGTGANPTWDNASTTDVKFSACLSTSHNDVTGDGTGWWTNTSGVSWSTPIINTGSGFSGGLFTVPAGGAGTYLFSFHSWIGGITSSHTEAYGYIETSNRNYEVYHGNPYASYSVANTSQSFNWQTIADMDVGDTCRCKMGIYNGTKVCDMRGNGGFNYTSTVFQGVLLA